MPIESLDDLPALLAQRDVDGVSLALTTNAGEHRVGAWGAIGPEPAAPAVDEHTLFAAGSISKPVTAFAALHLAHEARLDLDAVITEIIPEWRPTPSGTWIPAITTRMLLSHVAGLSGWGQAPATERAAAATNVIEVLEGKGQWPAIQFETIPNVMWQYSSSGYLVVQAVIERITGEAFETTMRELVFEPLGMRSSTFDRASRPDLDARAARSTRPRTPADPGRADGGLWTTPTDLMRFAAAVNSRQMPLMLERHPVEPRMGAGLFLTRHDTVTWWSHGGSGDGFEALLAGDADSGFAVAVMTNAPGGADIATQLAAFAGAEYGPAPVAVDHLTGEAILGAIRLNRFNLQAVGTYALPSGLEIGVSATPPDQWRQQRIQLTLPGQPTFELAWPLAAGQWRIPGLEAIVVYDPPDQLRLVQAGREVTARRKAAHVADRDAPKHSPQT